jgi:hypothetical protein
VEIIKPTTTRSLARLGSGSNAMIHKVCPHLKVHLTAAYMKSNRSGALEMKITRWRLRSNTADTVVMRSGRTVSIALRPAFAEMNRSSRLRYYLQIYHVRSNVTRKVVVPTQEVFRKAQTDRCLIHPWHSSLGRPSIFQVRGQHSFMVT